jgi:hypothetical protein
MKSFPSGIKGAAVLYLYRRLRAMIYRWTSLPKVEKRTFSALRRCPCG